VRAVHDLVVMPQNGALAGSVPAPPDEDLGHLALLVAALADGASEVRRLSRGPHITAMIAALRQLGIAVEDAAERGTSVVRGRALRGLAEPREPVFCGPSAPTLTRLAAVLVAHPFRSVLTSEPRTRLTDLTGVAAALRRRGAQIEGIFSTERAGAIGPPLTVGPLPADRALSGVEYELAELRPDVKEALLLSGLYADEATYVREHVLSRDHLERMLAALDVPVSAAGPIVALDPAGHGPKEVASFPPWEPKLPPFSFDVPGDVAVASLLSVLATLVKGSRVCVRGVGLNPTRTGAFDLLRQMGGDVELVAQATRLGEIDGTVCASYAPLRAVTMAGEPVLRAIDDLPVLVALAARARGFTEIAIDERHYGNSTDAAEYGGPASMDRIVAVLRAFAVEAERSPGGLALVGRPEGALAAADIDAEGSATVAALAVVLGLLGQAATRIRRADALAVRYPRIVGTLRALGADVRVESR
jgi:3-phosphoshikimate 1-carboxyvinyltransferase